MIIDEYISAMATNPTQSSIVGLRLVRAKSRMTRRDMPDMPRWRVN